MNFQSLKGSPLLLRNKGVILSQARTLFLAWEGGFCLSTALHCVTPIYCERTYDEPLPSKFWGGGGEIS